MKLSASATLVMDGVQVVAQVYTGPRRDPEQAAQLAALFAKAPDLRDALKVAEDALALPCSEATRERALNAIRSAMEGKP